MLCNCKKYKHKNPQNIVDTPKMGGCVTKRQRKVEEEVRKQSHILTRLSICNLQVRDLQDQVKGLQELVRGLQVHDRTFFLFETINLDFLYSKVTVGITAGLQDQLMDLQEKVRKMEVGIGLQ